MEDSTQDKFNRFRTRNSSKSLSRGGYGNTEELLASSSLDPEVLEEIEKVFVSDRASEDIDKSLIDESTIRLLEELSVPHAKIALNEFAHRCRVAPEKIRKSTAGYLRGVCLKYWKIGRAATKQQLADAYRKRLECGERVNKRKLIEDFIGHTFTPGSQLDLLLIDSTVRKKLFQLEPCDALDVTFEFVSAVTFRTSKIRNINAYMMSMINKAKTSGQMKTIDEILNRQKYGLPKTPDSKATPEKLADPPEWMLNEQQHKETQEWFHQKLAENGEEFCPVSSPEVESATTIWSPSQQTELSYPPNGQEKFGSSYNSHPSPVQTPYNNSESFFSKNDPTQSLSYVSDQDKDGSGSTEQCGSTGSSSTSGNPTQPEKSKEKYYEEKLRQQSETVRQQTGIIAKLQKKIAALEDHISSFSRYEEQYEQEYPFTHTPSQSFPHSPSNMHTPSTMTQESIDPIVGKNEDSVFDNQWKLQNSFERFQQQENDQYHEDYTRPRQRSEPTMKTYPTRTYQPHFGAYDGANF